MYNILLIFEVSCGMRVKSGKESWVDQFPVSSYDFPSKFLYTLKGRDVEFRLNATLYIQVSCWTPFCCACV